ncbi:MAG: right-handed parallel beta-helix repeat-containing protein [Propylenella sp.]
MSRHPYFAVVLLVGLALHFTASAFAQGQVVITQSNALAGNVTPGDPPGFPAVLSQPGSYILGSNLSPGAGLDAIVTSAPDITIDLNGFRLSGGPAGGTNNARIGVYALSDRLTVKNGTIGAFKQAGIWANGRGYLVVENVRIVNGYLGIYNENGEFARIQNSTIATNQFTGITCGRSCHVEGSVVSRNGGHGIVIGTGTVLGNTILNNTRFGISSNLGLDARVAFGNNTIIDNNGGSAQVILDLYQLHPNACSPSSPSC